MLGHSWGGMLAMAYAITKPPGLVSLLVHGSPASMPFALAEVDKLRASLQPVLCLALPVAPQDLDGIGVQTDRAGPAALGGPSNPGSAATRQGSAPVEEDGTGKAFAGRREA